MTCDQLHRALWNVWHLNLFFFSLQFFPYAFILFLIKFHSFEYLDYLHSSVRNEWWSPRNLPTIFNFQLYCNLLFATFDTVTVNIWLFLKTELPEISFLNFNFSFITFCSVNPASKQRIWKICIMLR